MILKASDQSPRLPTYHFAHAVDDHLMRVNLVIRGEEWISSVPTHLQLFDALGFERVEYAHIAPLMKQQGGSRRKLSKRKDPEASVEFFIEAGFPAPAVQYYMRGLVNARLAELPLAEALEALISLAECGVAGPLVDLVKLDDICADYVATLSGEEIISLVSEWAKTHDPELVTVLASERDAALAALRVERGPEVANPRKDLRKWADFRTAYGFFFPSLFPLVSDRTDERLGGLSPELISAFAADFADGYADLEDGQEWFGQIRELAAKHGFAPNPKELKKNPDAYPGSIREAAQLIRVALTGSKASPDLHAVARTLGTDEVLRRVRALVELTVRSDGPWFLRESGAVFVRRRSVGVCPHTAGMTGESACAREFTALRGRRVESWVGVEWALRADVPGSGPQFHDPEVPCLQLWGLQAVLGDGLFSICTFDEEAVSGLWRNRHEEFEAKLQDSVLWDEPGDCTRWRALSELPVGPIDEVTVYGDEGVVAEVLLVIGGRPLLLIAA